MNLCGTPTANGATCNRRVTAPGMRCYLHATTGCPVTVNTGRPHKCGAPVVDGRLCARHAAEKARLS